MSLIPAAVLPMPYLPAGSPLRVFLYLFVFPTMLGSRQARRKWNVRRGLSSAMAAAVTILMVVAWTNDALWILIWLLLWPACYLFLATWRLPEKPDPTLGANQPARAPGSQPIRSPFPFPWP